MVTITGANMRRYKLNYKYRNYILGCLGLLSIVYFGASITLHDIKSHTVEILEKSPLFPYENYDYMTTEEAVFAIDGKRIEIPAYFRTDFASIPKALWFLEAPYNAKFVYPAIWHDYMYVCNDRLSRKDIDDIFFWLLRYEQNSLYTSVKMYLAVRLFGAKYYNEDSCREVLIQEEVNENKYNRENKNHG